MEILSHYMVKFQGFGLKIESISNDTEMINGKNNQNNDRLIKVTHVPTCFVLREEHDLTAQNDQQSEFLVLSFHELHADQTIKVSSWS
jgi:hypothetical protein